VRHGRAGRKESVQPRVVRVGEATNMKAPASLLIRFAKSDSLQLSVGSQFFNDVLEDHTNASL